MSTPPDNLADLQNESYRFTPQLSNPSATSIAVVNPDGTTISGGGGGGGDVNLIEVGGFPVALGQTTEANSLPVVIANNQSAIPVSASTLPLPTGAATAANQATIIANQTNGTQETLVTDVLVPKVYDTIKVTAVDGSDNPTTIQYLTGGLGGTVVATLTIVYDGSENFQSVVRS